MTTNTHSECSNTNLIAHKNKPSNRSSESLQREEALEGDDAEEHLSIATRPAAEVEDCTLLPGKAGMSVSAQSELSREPNLTFFASFSSSSFKHNLK